MASFNLKANYLVALEANSDVIIAQVLLDNLCDSVVVTLAI